MNTPLTMQTDTVLVVDDTPESLRFLTDTLESAGISVLIATSGDAALALIDHLVPDLILMDALMPGMDGFEATRAIKAHPGGAGVPIIFMTGLTESEHVVRALEAGGIDYVRKPIVVEELLARVHVHMNNARQTQGSHFALDATGRNLIAIDASARITWATPAAERLILSLEPGWSRVEGRQPALLAPLIGRLMQDDVPAGQSLRLETGGGEAIELIAVGRRRQNELLVRLNHLDPQADIARLQQGFSLTQREAEVLLWISYGKPNRVISEILSISPRTVNKHLEQIFEKLGVETRAAAAAFAVRVIAQ
ncbi:response regulator [Sphingomonas sp. IW22]|uniref:response regulator n=1 Tax=Sphingomonas sp. IW22 TaxID=3242489 RepID=UPI0035222E0C